MPPEEKEYPDIMDPVHKGLYILEKQFSDQYYRAETRCIEWTKEIALLQTKLNSAKSNYEESNKIMLEADENAARVRELIVYLTSTENKGIPH